MALAISSLIFYLFIIQGIQGQSNIVSNIKLQNKTITLQPSKNIVLNLGQIPKKKISTDPNPQLKGTQQNRSPSEVSFTTQNGQLATINFKPSQGQELKFVPNPSSPSFTPLFNTGPSLVSVQPCASPSIISTSNDGRQVLTIPVSFTPSSQQENGQPAYANSGPKIILQTLPQPSAVSCQTPTTVCQKKCSCDKTAQTQPPAYDTYKGQPVFQNQPAATCSSVQSSPVIVQTSSFPFQNQPASYYPQQVQYIPSAFPEYQECPYSSNPLAKKSSHKSSYKSFLPMILNMLQERASGCRCPYCNCKCGNKNADYDNDSGEEEVYSNKSSGRKDKEFSTSSENEDMEDFDNTPNLRQRRKNKNHTPKKESTEVEEEDEEAEEYEEDESKPLKA